MFSTVFAWLKNNPIVIIAAIASAILGIVQTLGGHGILSGDVVTWFVNALHVPSPTDPSTGWLIPVVLSFLQRAFSWGPVTHAAAVQAALNTPVPEQPSEP